MFLPTPTGGNRLLPFPARPDAQNFLVGTRRRHCRLNLNTRAKVSGARCPQLSVPLPFQGETIGQGVGALNTYARRPENVDESVPCCGA